MKKYLVLLVLLMFGAGAAYAQVLSKPFHSGPTSAGLSGTIDVSDLSDGIDGELITWDAAGAPDTVAVGTATHVLTSNGVGLPPTFQVAAGGSTITVEDEGIVVDTDYTTLNFVGTGVTATDNIGTAIITVNAVVPSGVGPESLTLFPTDCVLDPDTGSADDIGDIAIGCSSSTNGGTTDKWDTAIGFLAKATGNKSTALGYNTNASGINAIAIGDSAVCSGTKCISAGNGAVASQENSIAWGNQTDATAFGAIAFGDSAQATHADSIAFGQGAATTAIDQIVMPLDFMLTLGVVTTANLPLADIAGSVIGNTTEETPYYNNGTEWGSIFSEFDPPKQSLCTAISDETTSIASTGTSVTYIPVPYDMRVLDVTLTLATATTTGIFTVDINEDAVSMLTTKLTVDATETGSQTASVPAVGFANALIDAGDRIFIDIDVVGDGTATGAKVCLVVSQNWL